MERVIDIWSNPGDRVLDPFCGSGSFLEAAITKNRFPVGCDKSSNAIEIAKSRLETTKTIFAE